MRKKKKTKADILRSWGMFPYHKLRYNHPIEKGVFWYYVSLEVRQRDVEIWGVCISCGRTITVDTCDAGHFMPAGDCGRDLLFDLRNVNAECSHCNAWDGTHLLGYADGLDKRYGAGTAQALRDRRARHLDGPVLKDWKAQEYAEKIRGLASYQQAISLQKNPAETKI